MKTITFQFNSRFYGQVDGIAMGSPTESLIADVCMNYVIDQAYNYVIDHTTRVLTRPALPLRR